MSIQNPADTEHVSEPNGQVERRSITRKAIRVGCEEIVRLLGLRGLGGGERESFRTVEQPRLRDIEGFQTERANDTEKGKRPVNL